MSERPRAMLAAIGLAALAACASPPPAAPKDPKLAEREAYCRDRMYIERGNRGRTAVNWNVYDLCMKEGR